METVKLGPYYIYIRFGKPYFVRPENGEKMWQWHWWFFTITRMGEEQIQKK